MSLEPTLVLRSSASAHLLARDRTLDFPLIDILRGFAAISVVIFHVIADFDWKEFPIAGPLVWFRTGGFGVDLFFVISGFVIALSAFKQLDRSTYRQFAQAFVRSRLARIVPLYALTCLVFMVFIVPALIFEPATRLVIVTHILFIYDWFVWQHGALNGANWSVALEMQFYLAVLLVAPWLKRVPWFLLAGGTVTISWVWRYGVFLLIDQHTTLGSFPVFVYTGELPGLCDEFCAGILLARLMMSQSGITYLAWAKRYPWVTPLLGGLAIWGASEIYWPHSSYWDIGLMVIMFKTVMAICGALLVLSACTLQYRYIIWLTAPLRYLGKISYGIYLWHLPVILSIRRVDWVSGPTALPYVLGFTVLFSAISWHFFERPLIDKYRKK